VIKLMGTTILSCRPADVGLIADEEVSRLQLVVWELLIDQSGM